MLRYHQYCIFLVAGCINRSFMHCWMFCEYLDYTQYWELYVSARDVQKPGSVFFFCVFQNRVPLHKNQETNTPRLTDTSLGGGGSWSVPEVCKLRNSIANFNFFFFFWNPWLLARTVNSDSHVFQSQIIWACQIHISGSLHSRQRSISLVSLKLDVKSGNKYKGIYFVLMIAITTFNTVMSVAVVKCLMCVSVCTVDSTAIENCTILRSRWTWSERKQMSDKQGVPLTSVWGQRCFSFPLQKTMKPVKEESVHRP